MSNEKDFFTNPGPWEYWPASKHIVDAEGNTVCTTAPDCSQAAINVMTKAPEAVKMLGDLLTSIVSIVTGEQPADEQPLGNLVDDINLAADFMKQFKSAVHG